MTSLCTVPCEGPRPRVRSARGLTAIGIGFILGSAAVCAAGTIRHDRADADYRAYANQGQFAAVGSYSTGSLFGSFTLIAPQWALTAAHVVDTNQNGAVTDEDLSNDRLNIGGLQRRATQLIVPTGVNGNRGWDGNINNGFDLALVRLDQPITTIAPAALYTGFQELGHTITSVGFGQSGTGLTGATGSSGTKRAGDNFVDEFVTFSNGLTGLRWDFDEPAPRISRNQDGSTIPLNMEYLIGPGDSGGGSFLFEGDAWYLAGVHSGTYDLFNYPGAASNTATYGDAALVTRVAAYLDFISSNIPELAAVSVPEPGHWGLAGVALLAPLVRRRRAPVAALPA